MAFSQFQKSEIRGPGSQARVRALLLDCRGLSAHCLLTWLRGEGGERNRGREIEKERDRDRDIETERRNEGENTPVRAMLFLLIRTVILWDQGSARTTHSTPITLLLQIQSRSQVGGQGSHSSVRSSRPVGLPRGPAVPSLSAVRGARAAESRVRTSRVPALLSPFDSFCQETDLRSSEAEPRP